MQRTKKTLARAVLIFAIVLIGTFGLAAAIGISDSVQAANAAFEDGVTSGSGMSEDTHLTNFKAAPEDFQDRINSAEYNKAQYNSAVYEDEEENDLTWVIVVKSILLAALAGAFVEMLIKNIKMGKKDKNDDRSALFIPLFSIVGVIPVAPRTAMIILGSVIMALLIGNIILFVLLRKRRKANETPEEIAEDKLKKNVSADKKPKKEQRSGERKNQPAVENDQTEENFVEDEETQLGAEEFGVELQKSFMAKLIQLDKDKQKYYTTLKNELLSYQKVKSRISWNFDTINAGRNKIAKFAVRGKSLCLYLALDPDKVDDKYKVEKIDSQKYAAVPCLYRIVNDRRVKYAIELITAACERHKLKKRNVPSQGYVMPYGTLEDLPEEDRVKERQLTAIEHFKREKAFDRTKNKSGIA